MSVLTDPPAGGTGQSQAGSGSGSQAGNQDWRTSLPEDLRSEKAFESIKGKDWTEAGPVLAKSYLNAQRMVGAEKLVVPGPNATPEEQAAFYGKIGRPETPDKYTYKLPEGVKPEQLNKTVVDSWLKELHEAGVPAKAADRIVSKYLADEYSNAQARTKAREKELQGWELGLKEELGAKYDEKLNYAKWALKEFGDVKGELAQFLDKSGFGSHPAIVKFFAEVGARMADDKARGTGGGPRFSQTPSTRAEAQAAMNTFNRDPEKQKALWDNKHPDHANVVKERETLFKTAFPKDDGKE